jgi:hypothetical protein
MRPSHKADPLILKTVKQLLAGLEVAALANHPGRQQGCLVADVLLGEGNHLAVAIATVAQGLVRVDNLGPTRPGFSQRCRTRTSACRWRASAGNGPGNRMGVSALVPYAAPSISTARTTSASLAGRNSMSMVLDLVLLLLLLVRDFDENALRCYRLNTQSCNSLNTDVRSTVMCLYK